ncbi:hypothetical protein H4R34_003134 [Dimargaris verticillata]|uniref:Peptidase S28 n=1 Tax=Dimargaris verticillata TaxID=2761393 RepID=A0A9W8E8J2_9FUNG|nr:hypothetical protein H4R34_003134 [Dimargaris verticillata]
MHYAALAILVIVCQTVGLVLAEPLAFRWADRFLTFDENELFDEPVNYLDGDPTPERWFPQLVDHFGLTSATFPQRFFVNDTWYQAGGPVYLYNPGEGANSARKVQRGFVVDLARATQGLVVSLEHRYYGRSNPVPDLSPTNMRYLSVAQALADMAYFIEHAPLPQIQSAPSTRWVVVGGSYAGNLAAWMRLEYPHLVFAAYSSSGPVRAKNDYYEYDLAVGDRLPCHELIADTVVEIDHVLDGKDTQQIDDLKKAFGLESLNRTKDFAGALVDQMATLVQYYAPPKSNHTDSINAFCEYFSNHTTPLNGFAAATRDYLKTKEIDAAQTFNTYLGAKNYTLEQSGRSWFYQTCTEFAYWQTAPRSPMLSMRSKYVDLDYNAGPCRAFFGSHLEMPVPVDRLNERYGADSIDVDRVFYVNGEFDPWRRLSVSSPVAPPRQDSLKNKYRVIPRASHCYDLRAPDEETDWPELVTIRAEIVATFQQWLNDPAIAR